MTAQPGYVVAAIPRGSRSTAGRGNATHKHSRSAERRDHAELSLARPLGVALDVR